MRSGNWQWRTAIVVCLLGLAVGCDRAGTTPPPTTAQPPAAKQDTTIDVLAGGLAREALASEVLVASRRYTSPERLATMRFDATDLEQAMQVNDALTLETLAAMIVDPELSVDARLVLVEIAMHLDPIPSDHGDTLGTQLLTAMLLTAGPDDLGKILQWMYFAADGDEDRWARSEGLRAAVTTALESDERAMPVALQMGIPAALERARRDLSAADPQAAMAAAWHLARHEPALPLATAAVQQLGGPATPRAVPVLMLLLANGDEATVAAASAGLSAHLVSLLEEGYDAPASIAPQLAKNVLTVAGPGSMEFAEAVLTKSTYPPLLAAARIHLARHSADRHGAALAAWAADSDDDSQAVAVLSWLHAGTADSAAVDAIIARAEAAGDAYRHSLYRPAIIRITGDPASPALARLPTDSSPGGEVYDAETVDDFLDRLAEAGAIDGTTAGRLRINARQALAYASSDDPPIAFWLLGQAGLTRRVDLSPGVLPRHHLIVRRLATLPHAPAVDLAWQRAADDPAYLVLDVAAGDQVYRARPRLRYRTDLATVCLLLDRIAADTDSSHRARVIAADTTHATVIWADPALDAVLADYGIHPIPIP